MSDTCTICGRTNLQVTVTFDKHDPVSILRALQDTADSDALQVVARAILLDGESGA